MSTSEVVANPAADDQEPILPKSVTAVFVGLMLVMLMASLDQTIVSTALPRIVSDLGGLKHISWVVTAYLLATTAVTPLYGKLGDQFGRKRILQVALVIFLLGSALCGIAQNFGELVAFRGLQGLGGGGLIVGSQSAIADVVAPRDRGRYQGYFGAVFGVTSVIGPLLGGFFTQSLTWRWIFYINLPIGVVALTVLALTFPSKSVTAKHQIDYAGTALLAVALSAIVLLCTLGGVDYKWLSPFIIGLGVFAIVLLVIFFKLQQRVPEPILPPRLFKLRAFSVTSAIGLIVGFAMMGSIVYLPLFLQVVRGATPTASGLQLLPMMAGLLITSITAGQIISKTGKYRPFPIAGTLIMAIGLFLLSSIDAGNSYIEIAWRMFVMGFGLGMVMQVLVLIVQNGVDYSDLGVATSGATLFRSIGGVIGTAIMGSLFTSRLAQNLEHAALQPAQMKVLSAASANPQVLKSPDVSSQVRDIYIHAFTNSINRVFVVASVIALLGFLCTWLIKQQKLRETVSTSTGLTEGFGAPTNGDSAAQLERALSLLNDRRTRRGLTARITNDAGVDLTSTATWTLFQINRHPDVDIDAVAPRYNVSVNRAHQAIAELVDSKLITGTRLPGDPATASGIEPGEAHTAALAGTDGHAPTTPLVTAPPYALTESGTRALAQLRKARQAVVEEMTADWSTDQREDISKLIARMLHREEQWPEREAEDSKR